MIRIPYGSTIWLLTILLVIVVTTPIASQPSFSTRVWTTSVDSVVAGLERETRMHVVNGLMSDLAPGIIRLPDAYASRRDSLLSGLEKLALTTSDGNVRAEAVSLIASAGKSGRTTPPLPGIMRRLNRIYRLQPDAGVQLGIRNAMPEQAERREAAAFLRILATEPDPANDGTGPHGYFSVGDPRIEALSRLSEMGGEGRSVLQAIHRSGEARSPQARAVLAGMAQRGFPVRDLRRREPLAATGFRPTRTTDGSACPSAQRRARERGRPSGRPR